MGYEMTTQKIPFTGVNVSDRNRKESSLETLLVQLVRVKLLRLCKNGKLVICAEHAKMLKHLMTLLMAIETIFHDGQFTNGLLLKLASVVSKNANIRNRFPNRRSIVISSTFYLNYLKSLVGFE